LPTRERVLTAQAIILATGLGALVLAALFAERRRHEAIVTENEARLQEAMRIGGVMAFDWDVRHGTSRRSENATQILGLDAQNPFSSAAFLEHVHAEDQERYRAYLHDLSPDNPAYVVTFRWRRPDAQEIWLEEAGRAEFDAVGRVTKVVGLTRD